MDPERWNGSRPKRSRTVVARLCLLAAVSLTSIVSCRSNASPISVGVVFDNFWNLGKQTLTESEKALLKETAFQTLRSAFAGFSVRFSEGPSGDRVIKVGETAYGSSFYFGTVGMTYPNARISSVQFDVLRNLELTVSGCEDIVACETKTRKEMVEGLGRGVGATCAHELGHQAGFWFALDSPCNDCYDGLASKSDKHFFGRKHWSPDALAIMRRVLPSDESPTR